VECYKVFAALRLFVLQLFVRRYLPELEIQWK
jgi:hypothetical protein